MILLFLLVAIPLISASSSVCPPKYTIVADRCVRLLTISDSDPLDVLLHRTRKQCMKDGSYLPIIRSGEDNVVINLIASSMEELKDRDILLVLDLICNNSTHRLEWADGSPLSYTPDSLLEIDFDCVQTPRSLFSKPSDGQWYHVLTDYNMGWPFTVMCITETTDSLRDYSL